MSGILLHKWDSYSCLSYGVYLLLEDFGVRKKGILEIWLIFIINHYRTIHYKPMNRDTENLLKILASWIQLC